MTTKTYGHTLLENIRFDLAPIYVSLCLIHGLAGYSVAALAAQQGAEFPPLFWEVMTVLFYIWVAMPFLPGCVAVIREWRGRA